MTYIEKYDFGSQFIKSKEQPIEYDGKQIVMIDRVPAKLNEEFVVTIESTNSLHPQGVGISEGVEVFGEKNKRAVVFEYVSLPPDERKANKSKFPFSFKVKCRNKKGFITFYNMCLFQGRQEWWHGGAGMIVEDIENGKRYYCNDFELNDDFDDIIFTVTRSAAPNK
jgi:hypothetical protein